MILSEEMKTVLQQSPYITLITINQDGTPHPIVVGGKKLIDGNITIGIYKMEITRENLKRNPKAWITAATLEGKPAGFRFEGIAVSAEAAVIFTPLSAQAMI